MLLHVLVALLSVQEAPLEQAPNTWVKRTPLATTPPSPRLGYEGDCAWDPLRRRVIRYGGHNQGGGGEQGSELWICDPLTGKWELRQPNVQPPGVCCAQQNVFDPISGRYLRFPAFSASHGWQWHREVYLNNSAVWSFDPGTDRWRDLAPLPAPKLAPLRCASWDSHHQVVVVFGGEGSNEGTLVYDPFVNTWTRMKPKVQPEPRSGGNMVYDAARRRHILFGAQFTKDERTWTYDLRGNEWRELETEGLPPADKNDAVLTYDPVHQVVLALVRVSEGDAAVRLETWALEGTKNRWTKMSPEREPDASGSRARVFMFAPELNAAILENRPHPPKGPAEQQILTYRFADGAPASGVPMALRIRTNAEGATLAWDAGKGPYTVFRGAAELPWKADAVEIGTTEACEWRDRGLTRGTIYHYSVRGSIETRRVRTQPALVEGVTVSVIGEKETEVSWASAAGEDVEGYHVERAIVEVYADDQLVKLRSRTPSLDEPSVGAVRKVGAFRRLTDKPVKASPFPDAQADFAGRKAVEGESIFERSMGKDSLNEGGKPYRYTVYAYRVRAVNALGVEGGPSSARLTIPGPVEGLFSREEGASCHLKWQRSPEKNLKGYRVYRMDGRYDKDAVTRLTPESIPDPSFTDAGAGKPTRRYYVVAVDSLGQEGAPSSPVWFQREWKSFYAPFVGEWHQ